ncbi:hypothetical protein SJAV_02910 [Sulfurisphaera javensis]|uniref:CobQ/CobB/MinD/ParA nucleotide binding domain-containing protein n=1 Tax=Sulfurisphaera javensis TaxID=2049879 RepID=A0AAT9GN99_9CREN
MNKRIRLLSLKGGVGKSTLAIQIANYLHEVEVPFVIEELDPLETICVITSCAYPTIKYFSINDFLYNRLKIDEKRLNKEYSRYQWKISIADMFTNVDPESEIVKFQNKITDKNLNVFITDKFTIKETMNYARKWMDPKVLIVNFLEDNERKTIEENLLDYVYGEGLFLKVYTIPYYSSFSEFENSSIVRNIIKDLLDILVQL